MLIMVFRRKKSSLASFARAARPRSRETVENRQERPVSSAENPLARRFQAEDEPDTIDLVEAAGHTRDQEQGVDTTRLLSAQAPDEGADPELALTDPVAGFLAIVSGPGRGCVSTLHYGNNSIGRSASQRVSLDYGDSRISRENHCHVTYDPVTKTFFLQPGDGKNLTYLDGQPVLTVTELSAGNHIRVGNTELRFVPLCGKNFDWQT